MCTHFASQTSEAHASRLRRCCTCATCRGVTAAAAAACGAAGASRTDRSVVVVVKVLQAGDVALRMMCRTSPATSAACPIPLTWLKIPLATPCKGGGRGFSFVTGGCWHQQPAHTFCSVLPLHTSWRGRMDARVRRLPGGSHFLEVLAP